MAQRGRKPGFKMTDHHKTKIGNSQILNNLIKHAEGKMELSTSQASTGLGLLGFVYPKMSAVQVSGDEENPVVTKEIGGGEKLAAYLEQIAERSGKAGDPDA